ncbi:MAG TPA: glycine--tRNA ligase subunit beta [Chthonomonadales bacterium]|nr:glycine--tRNA ligase subunit beta [Chthonomonadales bacterium]
MPDLVLEVGTEEMPAGAVAQALAQLRVAVGAGLRELRLADEPEVRVFGTPRRLIVQVAGVRERQPDQVRDVRGPARSVAFDAEGLPTGAALGFARKQGVLLEALETLATPQGEYVLARVHEAGKPVTEVAGSMLADAVLKLAFPKMMRWGDGSPRFVRPVRWVLALIDGETVPMTIAGVSSGRRTRGHRYLSPEEREVPAAADLTAALDDAFVMWDPERRRAAIREQADALAASHGARIPWDEDLLDENVWLTEWPTALLGRFDAAYLELPRPVLVTVMKKHQRFFPVEDGECRLLPFFVAVRNGGSAHLDGVREGNERVLTARFADARYFYLQDLQTPLPLMAERLERLIFQEKLGTMAEKRGRLELLAGVLADALGLDAADRSLAMRAATLCKADLVSQMVVELPSLQGVIGREYALAAGEHPAVADAIAEHYCPRSAGDGPPATLLGTLLAVADRIDTLVGYVGLGVLPSGSSDAYGLRRAAQGVVQMLANQPDMPPLIELELQAAYIYEQVNGVSFDRDRLCNDLGALFDQRLAALLEDRGVRYDLVSATLSGGLLYGSLVHGAVRRAETLQAVACDDRFVPLVQAAARVANILRTAPGREPASLVPGKEGIHGGSARTVERAVSVLESQARRVSVAGITEPAERALFDAAHRVIPDVARLATAYDYCGLYETLHALCGPVNRFFDDVLVMSDDPEVRRNRLALLETVDALFKTLGDLTAVVVA